MDWTKKQKKNSIDFNTVLRKPSKTVFTSKSSDSNGENVSISDRLKKIFTLLLKNTAKGSFILKKIKKFFYKRFFWGRGVYYRFSVLLTIIFMMGPVTVLAATSVKKESSSTHAASTRVIDTAYDTGNGKSSIPTSKTIESVENYVVQKGDTISSIAAKRDISADTLMYANNLNENSFLQVGQTLKILPFSGILYKVKAGDTLENIAKKYDIAKAGYSPQVMLEINLLDSTVLKVDQEILVPGATIDKPKPIQQPVVANKPVTRAVFAPPNGARFMSPTAGLGNITTCFSSIHPAVDIDSLNGLPPIFASAAGKVTYAGWGLSGGSGIAVAIDHGNGYVTQYLHLSKLTVSVGDNVAQGQQIGIMGSTGRSTGTHVHFIIKYNGIEVNPLKYVDLSKYPREFTASSC